MSEKCPKCGAEQTAYRGGNPAILAVWACGSYRGHGCMIEIGTECLRRQLAAAVERAEKAEAIVAKLWLTKDGIRITPGMRVWRPSADGVDCWIVDMWAMTGGRQCNPESCYASHDAALAARNTGGEMR